MHRARKRFGQHFLHDPSVIARILAAINPQPDDRLVEIGPGLGAITLPLLSRLKELHAVEIDRDAIRHLQDTTAGSSSLHIHEADILEFDLARLRDGARRLRVVGNLPYNISTPLLFRLIEQREHVIDMHFMLQKEVVDRMAAAPASEHYGRLTVMLAPWLRVEPLFDIGPGAFRPPPRVISTFVRLAPHASPLKLDHPRQYASIVAAAFSQRRKTLRNALKALLNSAEIEAAGVDPALRAEVVPPAGFAALASVLAQKSAAPGSDTVLTSPRALHTIAAPGHPARVWGSTMTDYKKILLVVDLSEDSRIIGERAKAIAACYQSEITLLHVVEYVPVEPMGEALLPTVQIEGELVDRARNRLSELANKLSLSQSRQLVETGSIKTEIIRTAQRLGADLIVLGSRERHGLAILLNFTEDTILHAAPCDVLAVRLH